jgi:putative endonuclease
MPLLGARPQAPVGRPAPAGTRGTVVRMRVKDAVGRFGEQVAADHLAATGLVILSRNWRCPSGEIDIVATEGNTLVFVEVKTRSSLTYGSPAEAVNARKAARVRRLALQWIDDQRRQRVDAAAAGTACPASAPAAGWRSIRFDVVSVVRHARGGVDVEHVTGAF